MKGTDQFKLTIQNYLNQLGETNNLFAKTLLKEGKNIDDCCTFIFNTMMKNEVNGATDEEVYKLAVHYYDEDDIDIGGEINCHVIVNHKVELTAEEIEHEKQNARDLIFAQEKAKMTKKKTPKAKKEDLPTIQTLF